MSPMASIERILCAVDFSPQAADNLAEAVEMAEKCGAQLIVLHVVNSRRFEGLERVGGRAGGELAQVAVDAVAEFEEERAEKLKGLLEQVNAARVDHKSRVTKGVPWERILEVAEEYDVQMIVLGAHGRGSVKHQLRFGTTAEKIFRRAQCRTLFLR